MLSTSWNEVARRNAWTCLSCSARASTQILISNTNRPGSSRTHQRRHSSSKTLTPPKNETRTINAPSDAPAETKAPTTESSKRMSNRLRRKGKDTLRDAVHRSHENRVNIPSVPSTQHLHPLGSFTPSSGDSHVELYSYLRRHSCSVFLLHS